MTEIWEAIRVLGIWRVIWYRTGYRPVSRFMHRFNLHYAPPVGPAHGENYCLQQHWCQWCGLRGDLIDVKRVGMKRAAAQIAGGA